jgi:porin
MPAQKTTSALKKGLSLILSSLVFGGACSADDSVNFNETTFTGDWNGKRTEWASKGIHLDFTHRSDVVGNLQGGIKRGGSWLGYTDARIRLDLDKLIGADGWGAYVQYHSELGGKPNAHYVGSFMGVNNIEVSTNTAQFSQLWLEKSLFGDRLSVLAGLYALDSEFYVTDTSGIFLHPSMGIGTSIAQTGQNGPPIFPMTALGTRVKYTTADKATYLQAAVMDGVPGNTHDPRGTHVRLDKGDGTLAIVEMGYQPSKLDNAPKGANKTAIGFWRYSARFDDLLSVDAAGNRIQRQSMGWYLLAERAISAEKDNPTNGLSGFVRFGTATAGINQTDWSGSLGVSYLGLLDQRDDDVAALGLTVTHASDNYRSINLSERHESMLEASYKYQMKPWMSVQTSLQRIVHPNMDSLLKDAWVLSARFEVLF